MYNMVCLGLGLEQDVEEEPVAEPATDTTETPTTDAPQNVEETTTDGNTETTEGNTETTEGNLESTTDNNDEMEQVD